MNPLYPLDRRLGGNQGLSCYVGNQILAFQPVSRRYTDRAIQNPVNYPLNLKVSEINVPFLLFENGKMGRLGAAIPHLK
jgi:hypothetical protein